MTEPLTDDRPDEPTAGTEDVQETPPQEAPDSPAEEPEDQGDPAAAARREAASYRRRLRDAEGERDRLAERVAGYQRRDVEALAEQGHGHDRMAAGSDLWTGGVQLADVLDEAGAIDPERVQAQVAAVLSERPHWRKNIWAPVDVGQGPRTDGAPSSRTFADVLREGANPAR
jgi:hypothetical protein